ncbi:solute carrier family 66 member 3 [Chrysoperla carnea]|uniref:solute carrier family 66 member 3 n=1 Tax=Chrysoperla carnea TaxID=189513 RepID=UPI001D094CB4|nr:solute carrier family 66 member 3 [Chrysoperla carnea]
MAEIEKVPSPFILYIVNFLSLITVTVCFVQKVPQIFKLREAKTAYGISLASLLLEVYSYSVSICYNYRNGYALLSYLEYHFLLVQDWIIIYLTLQYSNLINFKAFAGASLYFGIFAMFLLGFVPPGILTALIPFNTPISASSKVVQLIKIIQLGNAESISLFTWFISASTNFTRIISILMDSNDPILLLNFVVSTILSTSILLTAYYYKRKAHVD